MKRQTCDRCGRTLEATQISYHVWLWVVAQVNEETSVSGEADWDELVCRASERFADLSEELIASEVYARRSFLVCPQCKGCILEDPLHRHGIGDAEEG
jgi:hypothetical protein